MRQSKTERNGAARVLPGFKRSRPVVLALVVLLVAGVALTAGACTGGTAGAKTVADAIASYADIPEKAVDTDIKLTVTAYNGYKEAMTVGQNVKLLRTAADGRVYVSGSVGSTAFSDAARAMLDTLTSLTNMSATVKNVVGGYLNPANGTRAVFEAGLASGTLNARGDLTAKGETPDYMYGIDGEPESLFIGVKDSDVSKMLSLAESESGAELPDVVLARELMTPTLLPYDYASLSDELGGKWVSGTGTYHHRFSLTDAALKSYAMSIFNAALDEAYPDKTDATYLEIERLLDAYRDTVLSWFNFNKFMFTVETDGEGRLVRTATDFALTVLVPDSDLVGIISAELGVSAMQLQTVFGMLHMYVSASGGVSAVEVRVSGSVTEAYRYGADAVSAAPAADHVIFTPYATPVVGRHLAYYVEDEDGGDWRID